MTVQVKEKARGFAAPGPLFKENAQKPSIIGHLYQKYADVLRAKLPPGFVPTKTAGGALRTAAWFARILVQSSPNFHAISGSTMGTNNPHQTALRELASLIGDDEAARLVEEVNRDIWQLFEEASGVKSAAELDKRLQGRITGLQGKVETKMHQVLTESVQAD
jgi:hypothetical protein